MAAVASVQASFAQKDPPGGHRAGVGHSGRAPIPSVVMIVYIKNRLSGIAVSLRFANGIVILGRKGICILLLPSHISNETATHR